MLENKEQEKIAGIISDFFDGAVNEADIDILAMKIYEKYVAKLEQDLEFTTKTANELIEIKHKLEQELAELKEKAIVPRFKRQEIVYCFSYGKIQLFNVVAYLDNQITLCENRETGKLEFVNNDYLCINEQEAQAKLKEIQGNE